MIDPTAYPRPVPMSLEDAVALYNTLGQWPDVSATFLVFEMIAVEQRIGEWRFCGAARSLAGVFDRLAEFDEAFGLNLTEARGNRPTDRGRGS